MQLGPVPVLLLLLAAAAATTAVKAAEKVKTPMFLQWLEAQAPAAKAQTSGHYDGPRDASPYERLEGEPVCLVETRLRNCRCFTKRRLNDIDVCIRDYDEVPVSCCGQQDEADFMAEVPGIGMCNYQSDFFETAVAYDGTPTTKIGTFTATCEMKEGSERCDGPMCDGMAINVRGDILRYPKVAFVGEAALDSLPLDESCRTAAPNPSARSIRRAIPIAAKIQYERNNVYYVGAGNIFTGTFTVVSSKHATKYSTGQFQMAYPIWDPNTPPAPIDVMPEAAYRARSHQYNLVFFKPQGYYQKPEEQYKQPEEQYKQPEEQYKQPKEQYKQPEEKYEQPEEQYKHPKEQYKQPEEQYKHPKEQYKQPEEQYEQHEEQYKQPKEQYKQPKEQYKQPKEQYKQPEGYYKEPDWHRSL